MSSFSDSCAETRFVRFVMWQQLCAGSCFLCFFYLLWFIGSGCLAVDRARCPAMWVASTKKGDHSFGPYSSRCGAFELIDRFVLARKTLLQSKMALRSRTEHGHAITCAYYYSKLKTPAVMVGHWTTLPAIQKIVSVTHRMRAPLCAILREVS